MSNSGFLNAIFYKNYESFWTMDRFQTGSQKLQNDLKHLMVTENKDTLKYKGQHVKLINMPNKGGAS